MTKLLKFLTIAFLAAVIVTAAIGLRHGYDRNAVVLSGCLWAAACLCGSINTIRNCRG